jgi:hypothetical protein
MVPRVAHVTLMLALCALPVAPARSQTDDELAAEKEKRSRAVGPARSFGEPGTSRTQRRREEPAGSTADPRCEAGCLRAEEQGGDPAHYWALGFVDFQIGEVHIQADEFHRFVEKDAAGRSSSRIVAEGNVVFQSGDERLSGDRLEMDVERGTATLDNAYGYLEPEVFVEARRIQRLDDVTYRIEGGRFTSCAQPNPRWGFSASSATIKRDSRILAKNVVFRIKSVPALYLPLFYYPISEDERSTGFLFPSFGYSSYRGANLGGAFFWAMGRSADQTFSVDHYSDFGTGYGHEIRYAGHGTSNGSLETTLFRRDGDTWDHDLNWRAVQGLPGRFRATLNARLFSSTTFLQTVRDSLDLASSRNQRASLNVQGRIAGHSVQLVADHSETFFGDTDSQVRQHLPSLRISRSPQRIGRTGIVLGYEARAERLAQGDEEERTPYERFDVAPSLARPWATSFLQLEPSVGVRYTRWGASVDGGEMGGPPIEHRQLESNVEMRGPTFAKIFSLGGFISPRLKHEIGPELVWTYRTPVDVDVYESIPRFGGADYTILGTNQVRYSLVQKLLAKREGRGGRQTTYELASWRVSQTYFTDIGEGQNEFDPNYSTSFFGPGQEPSHYSPIQSRFRLEPFPGGRATFDAEYDVNYRQVRALGASLTARGERGSLSLGWSRRLRPDRERELLVPFSDTVRTSLSYELWPGHVDLGGAADYDFVNERLIRYSGRLRLGVQCCALMVQMIGFNYNARSERQFRFALELANIGSFGFGEEGEGVRRR